MRGLRMALGLVGVFGLSATAAADPAFFVGGGVGLYNIKIDGNSYTPPAGATAEANLGGNFEDSAAVWRFFGGYQFNKYLGLQADYVWYGDTQDQIPQDSSYNVKVNGDAWEAAVRLSYPFGEHFEVFSRVGWNWYNVDAKAQYVKGQSDSNDDLLYSGGMVFKFTPALSMSAEYEIIDISEGDLNTATLSFVYTIPRG
jgi:OmpA-OmpF porin, OOP family